MSLSHAEEGSRVHSPAAVWVESVSKLGFEACVREAGIGTNGSGIINWLAYQNHPKMMHGSVTFQGMWTTESKCDKVTFSQVRRLQLYKRENRHECTHIRCMFLS